MKQYLFFVCLEIYLKTLFYCVADAKKCTDHQAVVIIFLSECIISEKWI